MSATAQEPPERAVAPAPNVEERAALVLDYARTLFVDGEATEQVVSSARQLGDAFGVPLKVVARWGELEILPQPAASAAPLIVAADPTDVNSARVAAATHAIERAVSADRPFAVAFDAVAEVARIPSSPTWLFALGAATGALALAVIFGVEHLPAAILIFLSAGLGALLRRAVARYSANLFVQPFCAALLAGILGGIAARYQLSSSLRLVAVCPCMVLVPGPHVLNGAADLIRGRMQIGAARLAYAFLIVLAICVGVLLGLMLLGESLPVDAPGRAVAFWEDVVAAAVCVFAYSTFFSTPLRLLTAPIIVGAAAHAIRWIALSVFDANVAVGALVAALIAGIALTPIARRYDIPFAPIGFACVVSMMPGVYLFRMASGLTQLADGTHTTLPLLAATIADGITAGNIILALSLGLVVPKLLIERLWQPERHR